MLSTVALNIRYAMVMRLLLILVDAGILLLSLYNISLYFSFLICFVFISLLIFEPDIWNLKFTWNWPDMSSILIKSCYI